MIVLRDLPSWRALRADWERDGRTVGFVPTMGALHEGHLSLVRRSLAETERTVVSVLVNPTQFDDPADLEHYPRDLEGDARRLRDSGVDALLAPDARVIYPDGYRYRVIETTRSRELEGAHRPGHFDGVLTVVLKLLQLVRPIRAYFGEKDWQQLELVRGMAEAFFLEAEIVGCPIVRDDDGLAMSSRNARLGPNARREAAAFARVLRDSPTASEARDRLARLGIEVDYVEEREGRRLGAVRVDGVRLIDNVPSADRGTGPSGPSTAGQS